MTLLYPFVIYLGLPVVVAAVWLAARRKAVTYQLPITHLFYSASRDQGRHFPWQLLIKMVRILSYLLLLIVIARPQKPDERSKTTVEGVATMLVLDVSGSMNSFDDLTTQKTRFKIAQEEAIKFINRRGNDLLGLIIFGAVAASRCPLTADKKIINDIIKDTNIGVLNPDGTMLSMAISLGVNRLRTSSSASKVMVVLTDGEPSPGDLNPQAAVDLAKKMGVKIYTIGIGSAQGGYIHHPLGGVMQIPTPLNDNLLRAIAAETGGRFFHAADQKDLEHIYTQIDSLEKSSHETPVYAHYFELYVPFLLVAFLCIALEILLTTWWWVVL